MRPSLIIVGLGNHGKQYENTRHNAGYMAVDKLSAEFGEGEWQDKGKFLSHIQEARIVTIPILLVKPQTYMNRSGEAIAKLTSFYKLDPAKHVLVITDDIDLPLGDLRFREKGGPGTHNGLKSIVDQFGEEFPRLKIGLGAQPTGADLANWVLSTFAKEERAKVDEAIEEIPGRIKEFVLGTENQNPKS